MILSTVETVIHDHPSLHPRLVLKGRWSFHIGSNCKQFSKWSELKERHLQSSNEMNTCTCTHWCLAFLWFKVYTSLLRGTRYTRKSLKHRTGQSGVPVKKHWTKHFVISPCRLYCGHIIQVNGALHSKSGRRWSRLAGGCLVPGLLYRIIHAWNFSRKDQVVTEHSDRYWKVLLYIHVHDLWMMGLLERELWGRSC